MKARLPQPVAQVRDESWIPELHPGMTLEVRLQEYPGRLPLWQSGGRGDVDVPVKAIPNQQPRAQKPVH